MWTAATAAFHEMTAAEGFDDLKAVEAAKFLISVTTGEQVAPSAGDGWAAAEIDEAVVASAADGQWHEVPTVEAVTTFGL